MTDLKEQVLKEMRDRHVCHLCDSTGKVDVTMGDETWQDSCPDCAFLTPLLTALADCVGALEVYAALEKSCTEIAGEPFHGDLAIKALASLRKVLK